jgi:hypothetical protein
MVTQYPLSQSVLICEGYEELWAPFLGVLVLVYLYHLDDYTTRVAHNLIEFDNDMSIASPLHHLSIIQVDGSPRAQEMVGKTSIDGIFRIFPYKERRKCDVTMIFMMARQFCIR